jgi:hypothetical protein
VGGLSSNLVNRWILELRPPAHNIINHHHRTVDDQSKVDGTKAHEIAG